MFFTQRGLEQATDEIVAAYKARRFRGREGIYDLCTGVGGDLLALANLGEATGFDRDPILRHSGDREWSRRFPARRSASGRSARPFARRATSKSWT